MNNESEREAFEACMKEAWRHPLLGKYPDGEYIHVAASSAWAGWLAAKRHAAQQDGTVVASEQDTKGDGE